MSKEENVFFCKIAVHNKLVDLEDANACLREANQENMDVAEVLLAEQLLTEEQVAQISKAVKRKLGQTAAPPPAAGGKKRAKKGKRRQRPPAQDEPEPRARRGGGKKTDQTQLAISVASLVVVVAIIGIITFFWIRENKEEPKKTPPSTEKNTGGSTTKAPPTMDIDTSLGSPDMDGKAPDKSLLDGPELTDEAADLILNQALADAKLYIPENRFADGVKRLESAMSKVGSKGSATTRQQVESLKQKLVDLQSQN